MSVPRATDTAPPIQYPRRMTTLSDPITLPCGAVLPNRILKSAMSEGLGTGSHAPDERLVKLYSRWSAGGTGLLITGNVMVDGRALGEPGNVVVEGERDLEALTAWARAATEAGNAAWVQLNHPGKQSPRFLSKETVSPSAVGFGPKLAGAFAEPRALTGSEIEDLITRFATSAAVCKKAGFTGVQVHAAHGYLVSQFLSPHHNRRDDEWGGSLENRARFLLRVVAAIREAVGAKFPVAVKINSADFQKGGFTEEESTTVIGWLADAGIDLVEISGGTYEAPAMTGYKASERTKAREGYFLQFVATLRETTGVPLAVTGGFRTSAGMEQAVSSGATDLVGLARPLCIAPAFSAEVLAGRDVACEVPRIQTGIKSIDAMGMFDVTWYEVQLSRMAHGKEPNPSMGAWRSLFSTLTHNGMQAFKMRRAR